MNVRNEKKIEETEQYDDEVLEAGGLPPVELPASEQSAGASAVAKEAGLEVDAFLEAFYRNQE
jgi:hypothetical protein